MEDGPIMQNIRKGPIKVAKFLQGPSWRKAQERNKLIKLNWKETKGIPGNKAIKRIWAIVVLEKELGRTYSSCLLQLVVH